MSFVPLWVESIQTLSRIWEIRRIRQCPLNGLLFKHENAFNFVTLRQQIQNTFFKNTKTTKIEIHELKKVAYKEKRTFYVFLLFITSIFAALLKKNKSTWKHLNKYEYLLRMLTKLEPSLSWERERKRERNKMANFSWLVVDSWTATRGLILK